MSVLNSKRILAYVVVFIYVLTFSVGSAFAVGYEMDNEQVGIDAPDNDTENEGEQPIEGTLVSALFSTAFAGGDGSSANPYLIETAEQLGAIRELQGESGLCFRQAADINLAGLLWEPIGSTVAPFRGIYDGDGYAIENLCVNIGGSVSGLFGYVTGTSARTSGVIRNVTITGDSSVTGLGSTGGIVGRNAGGLVENCINTATVTGTGNGVGGIVGDNVGSSSLVQNCFNTGAVFGTDTAFNVGGIVGRSTEGNATVQFCCNTGAIGGTATFVGGLVGLNNAATSQVICGYSVGSVTGIGDDVGGAIGRNNGIASDLYYNIFNVPVSNTIAGITGLTGYVLTGLIASMEAAELETALTTFDFDIRQGYDTESGKWAYYPELKVFSESGSGVQQEISQRCVKTLGIAFDVPANALVNSNQNGTFSVTLPSSGTGTVRFPDGWEFTVPGNSVVTFGTDADMVTATLSSVAGNISVPYGTVIDTLDGVTTFVLSGGTIITATFGEDTLVELPDADVMLTLNGGASIAVSDSGATVNLPNGGTVTVSTDNTGKTTVTKSNGLIRLFNAGGIVLPANGGIIAIDGNIVTITVTDSGGTAYTVNDNATYERNGNTYVRYSTDSYIAVTQDSDGVYGDNSRKVYIPDTATGASDRYVPNGDNTYTGDDGELYLFPSVTPDRLIQVVSNGDGSYTESGSLDTYVPDTAKLGKFQKVDSYDLSGGTIVITQSGGQLNMTQNGASTTLPLTAVITITNHTASDNDIIVDNAAVTFHNITGNILLKSSGTANVLGTIIGNVTIDGSRLSVQGNVSGDVEAVGGGTYDVKGFIAPYGMEVVTELITEDGRDALEYQINGPLNHLFLNMTVQMLEINLVYIGTDISGDGKATFTIPFPNDEVQNNRRKYEFVILHLVDGTTPEILPVTVVEDGLRVRVNNFSPFAIGFRLATTSGEYVDINPPPITDITDNVDAFAELDQIEQLVNEPIAEAEQPIEVETPPQTEAEVLLPLESIEIPPTESNSPPLEAEVLLSIPDEDDNQAKASSPSNPTPSMQQVQATESTEPPTAPLNAGSEPKEPTQPTDEETTIPDENVPSAIDDSSEDSGTSKRQTALLIAEFAVAGLGIAGVVLYQTKLRARRKRK